MIITTTQDVPGMEVVEYKGLATGEVVAGINFIKDIGAGLRNFFCVIFLEAVLKDMKMKLFRHVTKH